MKPAGAGSLLIAVAVVLLAGGCGKKDEQPAVPSTAAVSPPRPADAKGGEVQSPPPGQANDHSSPAFKGGGQPDKSK